VLAAPDETAIGVDEPDEHPRLARASDARMLGLDQTSATSRVHHGTRRTNAAI
jgi:hypothetical protein